MIIKRNIYGQEVSIALSQHEIHMIIEESDKDSARNDLDYFIENNDVEVIPTDDQKERIIKKYLESRSDSNGEWYVILENAYYSVVEVEQSI